MQLPEHPYTHLPLDQLIDLAETNAEAAVLASRNSEDENLKAITGSSGICAFWKERSVAGIGDKEILPLPNS